MQCGASAATPGWTLNRIDSVRCTVLVCVARVHRTRTLLGVQEEKMRSEMKQCDTETKVLYTWTRATGHNRDPSRHRRRHIYWNELELQVMKSKLEIVAGSFVGCT